MFCFCAKIICGKFLTCTLQVCSFFNNSSRRACDPDMGNGLKRFAITFFRFSTAMRALLVCCKPFAVALQSFLVPFWCPRQLSTFQSRPAFSCGFPLVAYVWSQESLFMILLRNACVKKSLTYK